MLYDGTGYFKTGEVDMALSKDRLQKIIKYKIELDQMVVEGLPEKQMKQAQKRVEEIGRFIRECLKPNSPSRAQGFLETRYVAQLKQRLEERLATITTEKRGRNGHDLYVSDNENSIVIELLNK